VTQVAVSPLCISTACGMGIDHCAILIGFSHHSLMYDNTRYFEKHSFHFLLAVRTL
jgi:hypothetical protein